MIYLTETKKRQWNIVDEDGDVIYELSLAATSLGNKFEIVAELIQGMEGLEVEMYDGYILFDDWIEGLILDYKESNFNANLIYEAVPVIIEFAKKYVDSQNIDFSKFVDVKKATKTSIIFHESDIKELIISSTCLKLYGLFSCDVDLRPPHNLNNKIFKELTKNCSTSGVIRKIFDLISSKVFSSYSTDRSLWDLSLVKSSESPDNYIMTIFNHMIANLIATASVDANPIPYINSIIEKSIKWLMQSAHKDMVYSDVVSIQDMHSNSISANTFNIFTCNDLIGKIAANTLEIISKEYCRSEFELDLFNTRIEKVRNIYPYMKLFNLVICSEVLDIPYNHLLTISPKHAILLSIMMRYVQNKTGIFEIEYPHLNHFLLAVPYIRLNNERISIVDGDKEDVLYDGTKDKNGCRTIFTSTKSSYKLREFEHMINTKHKIFGFQILQFRHSILAGICGVLSASKKDLINSINNKSLATINNTNLERNTIDFFNAHYNGDHVQQYQEMSDFIDDTFF